MPWRLWSNFSSVHSHCHSEDNQWILPLCQDADPLWDEQHRRTVILRGQQKFNLKHAKSAASSLFLIPNIWSVQNLATSASWIIFCKPTHFSFLPCYSEFQPSNTLSFSVNYKTVLKDSSPCLTLSPHGKIFTPTITTTATSTTYSSSMRRVWPLMNNQTHKLSVFLSFPKCF